MIVVCSKDPLKLVDPVAEIGATLHTVGLKLSGPPAQTTHSGTPLSSRHARCRHEFCAGHGPAARALALVLLRLGAVQVADLSRLWTYLPVGVSRADARGQGGCVRSPCKYESKRGRR